ncbi:MAG TPA: DCC1-like thiol-disulfide oxidoreductase family protein [Vicinamibacterales bacterium]|jgi:predicted DCC family thiol-disulfide oxidoreductase YuxK|nr:DCC1-like thiol-disulfide oxidoreductase family protein [Vicinamibacterales bacterium]
MSAWTRFWFEPGPATTLGLCRALFFTGLCLWHIPHDYAAWGAYSDVFWMPIWLFDWFNIPLLSRDALDAVQVVFKVSLVLGAIGLFTRAATIVAFVLGTYLMGLPHNFGQTQHFDTLPVFILGALALSRAGDAWSLDAVFASARHRSPAHPADSGEYTWPIRFVWVAWALIFCAAGISKLRHSGLEWIFSDNLALLLQRQQYRISDGEPLTSWGLVVAGYPWLAQALAAIAVSVETFFPLVLFSRTARLLLVPAGLAFLVGIRVLMGPTFEQFMVCFVFWVPWQRVALDLHSRFAAPPARLVLYDGGCGLCSRSIAVLGRLDLLHRLRFADVAAEWDPLSASYPDLDRDACLTDMHVINRRGEILRGFDAYRSIAWVVPFGWLMLPWLYVPGVPAVGRRVYGAIASHRRTATCQLPLPAAPTVSRTPNSG